MDTDIAFLQELEEDLLEAVWRETLGRERLAGRGPRRVRHRRRWTWAAAGATVLLTVAGAIGYFVTRGPNPSPLERLFAPQVAYVPSAPPAFLRASDAGLALAGTAGVPSPASGPVPGCRATSRR